MSLLGAIKHQNQRQDCSTKNNDEEYRKQYQNFVEDYKATYRSNRAKYGFPKNNNFESVSIGGTHYYIWIDDEQLKFYEHPIFFTSFWNDFVAHHPNVQKSGALDFSVVTIPEPDKCAIPLQDVKYFYLAGSVSSTTELTGGKPTFNTGSAILGGLLAGTIGAIIAGQSTTPYRIVTKTKDTRKVLLSTTYGVIELPKEDIEALKKIIPSKYNP